MLQCVYFELGSEIGWFYCGEVGVCFGGGDLMMVGDGNWTRWVRDGLQYYNYCNIAQVKMETSIKTMAQSLIRQRAC